MTVCENGNVALHNARRQHLPTKTLNLQFPPEFVHVTFSQPFAVVVQRADVFNHHIQANELVGMGGDSTTEKLDTHGVEE